MAEFRKVGALWRTKSGKGYSGKVEETIGPNDKLYLSKNTYKEEGDKKPDLILKVIVEDANQEPEDTTPF